MNEAEGIRERLLASARRQLAAIEAEFGAAQAKGAGTEEALRLTRQHADNLEALRAALQRRIAELDEQCSHLARVISERDATIAVLSVAEAKKRAMEASFSWRITAPLRALRRKLTK